MEHRDGASSQLYLAGRRAVNSEKSVWRMDLLANITVESDKLLEHLENTVKKKLLDAGIDGVSFKMHEGPASAVNPPELWFNVFMADSLPGEKKAKAWDIISQQCAHCQKQT